MAGISPRMADPLTILEVNLGATVRLVDAIRGRMADGSAAVLIASNSAYFPLPPEAKEAFSKPLPPEGVVALAHYAPDGLVAYPLSKFGVMALVKREAKAFGERGARIVSISPGATDTAMVASEKGQSAQLDAMIAAQAVPRMARPEEMANLAVFLCSSKASFITATDILADGGMINAAGF
jgi:NAD(P)-dependent dehydrogenase (short-subunit alcohol dehydrogenase family)